jgi:hypothetical protein
MDSSLGFILRWVGFRHASEDAGFGKCCQVFFLPRATFCVLVNVMAKKKLKAWEEVERRLLIETFEVCDGDVKATSKRLGLSRPTILRWLKKYNLYKPLRRA